MAEEKEQQEGNIKQEYNTGNLGLNMDSSVNQINPGVLTYALNASVENFDANSVNYQNEPGNEICIKFPFGFTLIGTHFIQEQNKHIFFLTNVLTGESEIGYMINNDCVYRKLVNANCLNFNINYPIHKSVHRITNCSTEIYWTDGFNSRRYIDVDNVPYITEIIPGTCDVKKTDELDCNKLKIQPDFDIPQLTIVDVVSGGNLTAGTYQFAIQYSDAQGNPYTSYYSITNPTPIADPGITSVNFNYPVGKSIVVNIDNIDISGKYQYFNLAVLQTSNAITSVELVGTYYIDNNVKQITYTGQNVTNIRLSINDIFEKFPYYDVAQDVTAVQDVLVWDQLTVIDRINYQKIANQISLQWESWRIPATENYADEFNATNLRGYLRDEVYAFEIVFLLKNGKQTDGFHIPGRTITSNEASTNIPDTDPDFIGQPEPNTNYSPYWKIYNTASVLGTSPEYTTDDGYKGPYQYGEFAYWESSETYPCNEEVWGDLANQPIRHHKFPDVEISPIFETGTILYSPQFTPVMTQSSAIYPIGVKVDVQQIKSLIQISDLTKEEKDDIVGFKIVRGDRDTNKSIIGKGILRNVGSYEKEEQTFYFPNYPYNDLNEDAFINSRNNAYSKEASAWLILCFEKGQFQIVDLDTFLPKIIEMDNEAPGFITSPSGNKYKVYEICSIGRPIILTGRAATLPAEYDVIRVPNCAVANNYRAVWESVVWYNNTPGPLANTNLFLYKGEQLILGLVDSGCSGGSINYSGSFYMIVDVGETVYRQNTNQEAFDAFRMPTQVFGEAIFEYDQFEPPTAEYVNYSRRSSLGCATPIKLNAFSEDTKKSLVFNSPETSFGQPFLGDVLKLESVIFGGGKAHFVEVKNNAKYRLLSKEAQEDALKSSFGIAGNDKAAIFAAYQAYLEIYVNGITRKNYAYSFNSIADYNYSVSVPSNQGIKQRQLDINRYLIPGVQSVESDYVINNYQRETSVYLKTNLEKSSLPYPSDSPNCSTIGIKEYSRFTIGETNVCTAPAKEQPIKVVSYYGSLKNVVPNQWGQIYSYEKVDTGCQVLFTDDVPSVVTAFGGDTFIGKFAFKTKLPFFTENRVNAPDDSDVFYDEIGNIGYPKFWHSARSILDNFGAGSNFLSNIISYKATNFDCPNDPSLYPPYPNNASGIAGTKRTFYDGYFYLFAYGIPSFYCESSYNLDLRQAFNNREGEFWPHVSTDIPDEWVQQSFVPIEQDNTYYYNTSFSKQNKENIFTNLPIDWNNRCFTSYPFRAIYSEKQFVDADTRVNNWLIYRPLSYFDFPQNYGGLVSLDGIQNRAILARFENKTLMYNNLLTIDTSNPQAAYVGNPNMFSAPPIDFAETDLGYVGSQNKMLLKIPQGQITVDAKRGQIFLVSGTQAVDLTAFGSGVNRFMTDHLAFEILRYYPNVDVDNHFSGIGLHGVYDSKFDRVIITKLDYIPLHNDIKYDEQTKEFYVEDEVAGGVIRTQVYLTDSEFFCNKSWTISFNFNTKSWVSFHSYIPNFYIGENNFFYSGLNGCCDDLSGEIGFNILVGPIDRTITTTTTLPPAPLTTTSTTTVAPFDCKLGATIVELYCDLDGSAVITVDPAPTTTICNRPLGLSITYLYTGYEISPAPPVDSTVSLDEACSALSLIEFDSLASITPITLNANVLNPGFENDFSTNIVYDLEVGQVLYSGLSNDCTFVPDGYYFTSSNLLDGSINYRNVIYVSGGTILEIIPCDCSPTTTSTTTMPVIDECCGILFSYSDTVYYSDILNNMIALNIPGYVSSLGIAMTQYKFWSVSTFFEEWDITLSPFTATYNRSIGFPLGFTTSSGIVAIDDQTLLCVDDSVTPQEVCSMDVTAGIGVKSILFTLPANREAKGNPLISTNGKIVIGNYDTVTLDYYLTQYANISGTFDFEIVIPFEPVSIFVCDCNIFVVNSLGEIYLIDDSYALVPSSQILTSVLGGTQLGSCITRSLEDYQFTTSTTTSTSSSTTTTTTTSP